MDKKIKNIDKQLTRDSIPWEQLSKLGINRDYLENSGNIEKLLRWQMTDIMNIKLKVALPLQREQMVTETESFVNIRGALRLYMNKDGEYFVRPYPVLDRIPFHFDYYGHTFSIEERKALETKGHADTVIQIFSYNPETGKFDGVKEDVLVSIHKPTNNIISYPVSKIQPKLIGQINGVQLTEFQLKSIKEGKAIQVNGVRNTDGRMITTGVRFDACQRKLTRVPLSECINAAQKQGNKKVIQPKLSVQ